ncbi:tail terminator [Arthrobacter phage CallinAllBarbz]|uniref:Tail terminator n=1 Tax=Arthrobacter phage CallinAllBarbz TaxID=3077790 RepID=A0AA96HG28_9CAUD|nr:tail terminator [Arthrobacter phage CallinAllBarbz]
MLLQDSEALYVQEIRRALADSTPVATRAPTENDAQYVRISRVGGPAPYPFLDQPMLTIECWATNDAAAERLGARVRAIVWAMDGRRIGDAMVSGTHETGGLTYFDDPDTPDYHRYQFTIRAALRWRTTP